MSKAMFILMNHIKYLLLRQRFCVDTEKPGHCYTITRRSRYLLPPEELLEEVVRLRLSAPILTRVRRSVDILFLEKIVKTKYIHYS